MCGQFPFILQFSSAWLSLFTTSITFVLLFYCNTMWKSNAICFGSQEFTFKVNNLVERSTIFSPFHCINCMCVEPTLHSFHPDLFSYKCTLTPPDYGEQIHLTPVKWTVVKKHLWHSQLDSLPVSVSVSRSIFHPPSSSFFLSFWLSQNFIFFIFIKILPTRK